MHRNEYFVKRIREKKRESRDGAEVVGSVRRRVVARYQRPDISKYITFIRHARVYAVEASIKEASWHLRTPLLLRDVKERGNSWLIALLAISWQPNHQSSRKFHC